MIIEIDRNRQFPSPRVTFNSLPNPSRKVDASMQTLFGATNFMAEISYTKTLIISYWYCHQFLLQAFLLLSKHMKAIFILIAINVL